MSNSDIVNVGGIFLAAVVLSLILCGIILRVARWAGFTDKPNEQHKQHGNSIPLGGGVGVFLAVLIVSASALVCGPILFPLEGEGTATRLMSLTIAASVILAIGTFDDRYGMRGIHKLIGQSVAAAILVAGGYHFRAFAFSGFVFEVGNFGGLLSVFWILGAINAINLIDGADGVAATLGIGICASLGIVAAITDGTGAAVIPLSMSGALLGFLAYNFPPAKMYLGDSGSMLIGLIASAAAIEASTKTQATFALAAPVALLSIPIMDTSLAIFRRKLMGRSIYDTDRGHLHHCLLNNGVSPRQVVGIVAAFTLLTSVGAIATLWVGTDLLSLLAVIAVLGICIRWRLMGRGEFDLVVSRVATGIRQRQCDEQTPDQAFVHIQGDRDWRPFWSLVVEFSRANGIRAVEISASMPWLHESFSGRYGGPHVLRNRANWRLSAPLTVEGQDAGWIEFGGIRREDYPVQSVKAFELVDRLQSVLADIERENAPLAESYRYPTPSFDSPGASKYMAGANVVGDTMATDPVVTP